MIDNISLLFIYRELLEIVNNDEASTLLLQNGIMWVVLGPPKSFLYLGKGHRNDLQMNCSTQEIKKAGVQSFNTNSGILVSSQFDNGSTQKGMGGKMSD